MSDERMNEMRDLWELAYKNIVGDCGDRFTIEEIACIFFELGFVLLTNLENNHYGKNL